MGTGARSEVLCAGCGSDCYESFSLRVVCCECLPNLDFCLQCFSSSVTVGQHRASHQYRFEVTNQYPILNGDWSASELLELLEGLEQFGYGNWNDVSRYVDTKGPSECRDAVNQYFVHGPIGNRTYNERCRGSAIDHTTRLQPSPVKKVAEVTELNVNERLVLGWLPTRDEFEVEFANDAESMVSGLDQGKNDEIEEEIDVALKLAHVEIYQTKLKERERRRKTARDYSLVKEFFSDESSQGISFKQSGIRPKKKDHKSETLEKLKLFSNFQSVEEHRKFVSNVAREKDLKTRIKELIRYRKNGVVKCRDGDEFDSQRLRRNKLKAERKRAAEAGLEVSASLLEQVRGVSDMDSVINITNLPGYDLLSVGEKRLCTSLRLHPNLYLSYKTCLIRDHIQKRRGQITRPLHPSGLDKIQRKKIFNYLLHAGWISAY